ncbi:MAG: hypothetical protein D8H99_14970 [Streptococcus sp.]|nr:MAG: hypothetical protein D8H99_14970 [Streptococcus sp.]
MTENDYKTITLTPDQYSQAIDTVDYMFHKYGSDYQRLHDLLHNQVSTEPITILTTLADFDLLADAAFVMVYKYESDYKDLANLLLSDNV